MKKWTFYCVLAFVTACGESKSFKGEGQQAAPETYNAEPEPLPVPVMQKPVPPPEPPPECPNPVEPITQGSFTVWTEPACPKPFEVYEIIIEVALTREQASLYSNKDLSGSIVGSDGFGKGYGPGTGTVTTFKVIPEGALFRVPLYRGADIVSDTVQINSVMLLEYQSIIIAY